MKTLANYKSEYKKAKTQKGKSSSCNRAMLNLSFEDNVKFLKFQILEMNK